jgi:hypothetical protein
MVGPVILALQNCGKSAKDSETLKSFLIVLLYFTLGMLFYSNQGKKEIDGCELEVGDDEDACTESWTLIDSLYFSVVTMSTVGYGDLSPSTNLAKAFTLFYIVFGVTVVWVKILNLVSRHLDRLRAGFRHLVDKYIFHQDPVQDNGTPVYDPERPFKFWFKGLAFGVTMLLVIQVVFAGIFVCTQPDMGYGNALYHCLVTATTVGYGDIALATQAARVVAIFQIFTSVTWLASFISHVDELRLVRQVEIKRLELLTKPFDREKIKQFDRGDGHGVDKCEFVVGMLICLGAQFGGRDLEWEDVQPFVEKFNKIDKDKDGHLTKEDIVCALTQHREERIHMAKKGTKHRGSVCPTPNETAQEHEHDREVLS